MKPKFGIVSSFDVLCGNATYSEAIAKGLEEYFDVVKIDLPLSLQKQYEPRTVRSLIEKIKECDHINIQMELGLYGPTPSAATRVLRSLIRNCNEFSITMHRVEESPMSLVRSIYNVVKAYNFKSIIPTLLLRLKDAVVSKAYSSIINEVVSNDGTLIVHTEREKKRIKKINDKSKIQTYPIVWPITPQPKVNLRSFFQKDQPIVGLFGFITAYKNYEIVAEGLIDEPFNILIAGGVHPQSPSYGKRSTSQNPSYIRKISSLFSSEKYKDRVYILASPSDDELIKLIQSVDIVCVPYLETGQSGSGIASLAIQYGRNVVFSDNACTRELARFLNKPPIVFDADSPLGLACAIRSAINPVDRVQFNGHDFSSLLRLYAEASCRAA